MFIQLEFVTQITEKTGGGRNPFRREPQNECWTGLLTGTFRCKELQSFSQCNSYAVYERSAAKYEGSNYAVLNSAGNTKYSAPLDMHRQRIVDYVKATCTPALSGEQSEKYRCPITEHNIFYRKMLRKIIPYFA